MNCAGEDLRELILRRYERASSTLQPAGRTKVIKAAGQCPKAACARLMAPMSEWMR